MPEILIAGNYGVDAFSVDDTVDPEAFVDGFISANEETQQDWKAYYIWYANFLHAREIQISDDRLP